MQKIPNPVFRGLTEDELHEMQSLHCLTEKQYRKDECVFYMGDTTTRLGIVQSGSINIESVDLWGNRSILSNIEPGGVFAETYALTGEELQVDAVATEKTTVLFLDVKKVLQKPDTSWYRKLLQNLLMISSKKNLHLSSRIFYTTPKKIRPRVQSYLSACARKAGSNEFDIPFDRQELADFLNLDRSALSKELSHMKEEGLLDYRKNHFVLFEEE